MNGIEDSFHAIWMPYQATWYNELKQQKGAPVQAIEFETRIDENGQVTLPAEFQNAYGKRARLVVLLPDEGEPLPKRRCPGSAKGKLTILSEDDEHLDDFTEYMP